ncbi:hypothetical protein ACFV6E_07780 [Streptomyces sp. NPDC059785]|uniref:hypothetical protein n=1 Tax=Streptomyces sp. NPDC059785 TaxID=3346945 RepID=UPI003659FE92
MSGSRKANSTPAALMPVGLPPAPASSAPPSASPSPARSIEALQTQLAALRQDHSILVNVQQALGLPSVPTAPAAPAPKKSSAVPAPRKKKPATASSTAKPGKAEKPSRPSKAGKSAKAAAPATKQAGKSAGTAPAAPTLVDLVREHLAAQSGPRSAAEVTTALGKQHPERTVRTTVIRTTLGGLVAKNQAQRAKQGSSVFYTKPGSSETVAQDEAAAQQSA